MPRQLVAAPPLPPGAWPLRGDGLTLSLRAASPILHLEGLRAAHDSIFPKLPTAGRCITDIEKTILSIGPATYLWLGAAPPPEILARVFHAAIDMSSGWTQIAIEGPNAVALLRKGCAVDLHPRQFPAGACAATGMARMRTILWRGSDAPRYDLLVARSYALSLWEWLSEAAAEFGCDVHNTRGAG